jgi:Cu(I)/Ag(I) efflux system membrane protein CusA/SilA
MIARLIAWSARNLVLVFVGTAFAVAAGVYAVRTLPLDAIPDLSDVQVIVYTEYPGQAPQVIEDQVTYPLTTSMLTVPKARVVRGFSFFGVSFVYVIFEDGTDPYWARSRVLEYLNAAARRLPTGVSPTLGPDATGVGWVYQYAVMAKEMTLAELRSVQDWSVPRAWPRSPASAASSSNMRSWSIRCGCGRKACRWRPFARLSATATWMSAGAPSNLPNSSSWCAGAAT